MNTPAIRKAQALALRAEQRSDKLKAGWGSGRAVTRKPFTYRYAVTVDGGKPQNVATAAEALRIARLYANTGSAVLVRDRTFRQAYLTESELEAVATEEANA